MVANPICVGTSVYCFDSTVGGEWSSSNTTVATMYTVTGLMTGVGVGTTTISYTLFGSTATVVVTVNPSPGHIAGISGVIVGDSISLSDSVSGGTWTSGTTTIASVGSTSGIVDGVSVGTAVITYALTDGCHVTDSITVYAPIPHISGIPLICNHDSASFTDSISGGTWISSDTLVATVVSASGLVTGVSPGTAVITYEITTGAYATYALTVNPAPGTITGIFSMLVTDSVSLSDTSSGGMDR